MLSPVPTRAVGCLACNLGLGQDAVAGRSRGLRGVARSVRELLRDQRQFESPLLKPLLPRPAADVPGVEVRW